MPGVFVAQTGKPPTFFTKQRAGKFSASTATNNWPAGNILATGDLNNDLRADFVVVGEKNMEIIFAGNKPGTSISLGGFHPKGLLLADYDNDGWLNLIAYGNGLRVWRNLGATGFADVTSALGLEKISAVDSIVAADTEIGRASCRERVCYPV